jgi:hypothetical protein
VSAAGTQIHRDLNNPSLFLFSAMQDLFRLIAADISNQWRPVMKMLGLFDTDLTLIERRQRNKQANNKELAYLALVKWEEREQERATLEKLSRALSSCRLNQVAGRWYIERSKCNISCCAQHLHDVRRLHDAHRTQILRVTFA